MEVQPCSQGKEKEKPENMVEEILAINYINFVNFEANAKLD